MTPYTNKRGSFHSIVTASVRSVDMCFVQSKARLCILSKHLTCVLWPFEQNVVIMRTQVTGNNLPVDCVFEQQLLFRHQLITIIKHVH